MFKAAHSNACKPESERRTFRCIQVNETAYGKLCSDACKSMKHFGTSCLDYFIKRAEITKPLVSTKGHEEFFTENYVSFLCMRVELTENSCWWSGSLMLWRREPFFFFFFFHLRSRPEKVIDRSPTALCTYFRGWKLSYAFGMVCAVEIVCVCVCCCCCCWLAHVSVY